MVGIAFDIITSPSSVNSSQVPSVSPFSVYREMLLCFVQPTFTSPSQYTIYSNFNSLNPTTLLPKTFLPGFGISPTKTLVYLRSRTPTGSTHASLLEAPVLWASRICVFYALLKAGLAGSQANPFVSGSDFAFFWVWWCALVFNRGRVWWVFMDLFIFCRFGKWW